MTIKNAMVLAAGLGTRLRPLTNQLPKPLVAVAGKPMITYVLDLLADAGVTRAVVNVHHLADLMEDYLRTYQRIETVISDERTGLLDSGGGLKKGLTFIEEGPVFVMNADLFWVGEKPDVPANLQNLAGFFDQSVMDMALLCVPIERTTGHNGKKDFELGSDGRLARYTGGDNAVVYAGALVMHTSLLKDAPDGPFSLNVYFDKAIANSRLFGRVMEGEWITVGTPEALPLAEVVIGRLNVVD